MVWVLVIPGGWESKGGKSDPWVLMSGAKMHATRETALPSSILRVPAGSNSESGICAGASSKSASSKSGISAGASSKSGISAGASSESGISAGGISAGGSSAAERVAEPIPPSGDCWRLGGESSKEMYARGQANRAVWAPFVRNRILPHLPPGFAGVRELAVRA
jgi:hypothetical protein